MIFSEGFKNGAEIGFRVSVMVAVADILLTQVFPWDTTVSHILAVPLGVAGGMAWGIMKHRKGVMGEE